MVAESTTQVSGGYLLCAYFPTLLTRFSASHDQLFKLHIGQNFLMPLKVPEHTLTGACSDWWWWDAVSLKCMEHMGTKHISDICGVKRLVLLIIRPSCWRNEAFCIKVPWSRELAPESGLPAGLGLRTTTPGALSAEIISQLLRVNFSSLPQRNLLSPSRIGLSESFP